MTRNLLRLAAALSLISALGASPLDGKPQPSRASPAASSPPPAACTGKSLLEHRYIGAHGAVRAEFYACGGAFAAPAASAPRANDRCGAPCARHCFAPAGGGPDPRDCAVIADALLYEGQNTGARARAAVPIWIGLVLFFNLECVCSAAVHRARRGTPPP